MNHKLPIEQGRFWGIERDHGDEFHYLFKWIIFSSEIQKFLPYNVYKKPNTLKQILICADGYGFIVKHAKICKIVLSVIN